MNKRNKSPKESLLGKTYCYWTVIDELKEPHSSRPDWVFFNLKISCTCGYSKKIARDCFMRKALADKCCECLKKEKHENI